MMLRRSWSLPALILVAAGASVGIAISILPASSGSGSEIEPCASVLDAVLENSPILLGAVRLEFLDEAGGVVVPSNIEIGGRPVLRSLGEVRSPDPKPRADGSFSTTMLFFQKPGVQRGSLRASIAGETEPRVWNFDVRIVSRCECKLQTVVSHTHVSFDACRDYTRLVNYGEAVD